MTHKWDRMLSANVWGNPLQDRIAQSACESESINVYSWLNSVAKAMLWEEAPLQPLSAVPNAIRHSVASIPQPFITGDVADFRDTVKDILIHLLDDLGCSH